MRYKRDEPFRFQFPKPLHGSFRIIKMDDKPVEARPGTAEIMDLSPNGLRFKASMDLPVREKKLLMEMSFIINDSLVTMTGEPVWQKHEWNSSTYGFVSAEGSEKSLEIIQQLKEYARKAAGSYKSR
ncbi:PilZ domain-containing protein [Bacillus infantis]|uniref:PilZ domain-containing protein n=1 Tax=Bacillus infantis TaxID=324767 RepID=UPI003CF17F15